MITFALLATMITSISTANAEKAEKIEVEPGVFVEVPSKDFAPKASLAGWTKDVYRGCPITNGKIAFNCAFPLSILKTKPPVKVGVIKLLPQLNTPDNYAPTPPFPRGKNGAIDPTQIDPSVRKLVGAKMLSLAKTHKVELTNQQKAMIADLAK